VSAQKLQAERQADSSADELARREFANTPEGIEDLRRWRVGPGRRVRVVMEATGLYGLDLALRLEREPNLELMVANPRAVRHFAHALMKRSKNDPLDTRVLVEFARRMPFQRWPRPSPAALHLHALARRLEALSDMHAAQLSEAWPQEVQRDLQRSLRSLERALQRLTRQAVAVIAQDPDLHLRYQLLLSACGIGPTSAVQILAQLAVLSPDLDARPGRQRPRTAPARFLPPPRRARQNQNAGPGRRHAQTPARHLRYVQTPATLRRRQSLRPVSTKDFHSGGRGLMQKRKASCTFKREKPLEIQERIYPSS
jgi:Transposase